MTENCYKIVLIGDGGVGKTTYLRRHTHGEFNTKYIATIGVELHPITFNTNYGKIIFNIWDTAGKDKFAGLPDSYYICADAAIAFFDVTNPFSFKKLDVFKSSFTRVRPNAKIVTCGNKCDEKDRKVMPREIREHMKKDDIYYEVSAKTNYNFEKPFLCLARLLTGNPDLYFVEPKPIVPTEITLDLNFDKKVSPIKCIPNTETSENEPIVPTEITLDLNFDKKVPPLTTPIKCIFNTETSENELFKLFEKINVEINKIMNLVNEKNLIIIEMSERIKLLEEKILKNDNAKDSKQIEIANNNLIKIMAYPLYIGIASEIWTLSKEEFIKKHNNSMPPAYINAVLWLYEKSKSERERILIENEIFSS